MARPQLPRPRAGEEVRADHVIALADAIEGMLNVRTSAGISARFGLDGLLLTLTGGGQGNPWVFPVWLTAVHSPGGETGDALPSEITYDYEAKGKGWGATLAAPVWRCVRNDECRIYPQLLAEPAYVLRLPTGEASSKVEAFLVCPGECPARAPCETPGELRSPERDEELWGLMMALSARVVELSAVARGAAVQAPAVGAGAASTSWWEWMRGWWR